MAKDNPTGLVADKYGNWYIDEIAKHTGSGTSSRDVRDKSGNIVDLSEGQWSALGKQPKSNGLIYDKHGNLIEVPDFVWDDNQYGGTPNKIEQVASGVYTSPFSNGYWSVSPEGYIMGNLGFDTKTPESEPPVSSAPEAAPRAPRAYKQPTYVPVREYIDLGDGDWTLGNPVENPYGSFSQDDLLKMYPDFENKYIFGDGNLEDLAYELAGQGRGYQYLVDQSIEDPEKAFEDLFAKAAMAYPDYSEEEILGLLDSQAAAYTMQDLIRMLGSYYNPDDPNSTRWARATAAQQRYDAQHPQSARSE